MQSFLVPAQIQEDIRVTEDRLSKIANNANLFALRLSPDGTELFALGTTAALDTAHVLVNMHFIKVPHLAKVRETSPSCRDFTQVPCLSLLHGKNEILRHTKTQITC
jgi:hypothetical protein